MVHRHAVVVMGLQVSGDTLHETSEEAQLVCPPAAFASNASGAIYEGCCRSVSVLGDDTTANDADGPAEDFDREGMLR